VDLTTGAGIDDAVAAQTLAEGVVEHADLVLSLARAALDTDIVKHAAARPHWRETYTGTVIGDRVLEGIIDLLYRDDDGLVIVDYKTDAVPIAALSARVDYYRPQPWCGSATTACSSRGPLPWRRAVAVAGPAVTAQRSAAPSRTRGRPRTPRTRATCPRTAGSTCERGMGCTRASTPTATRTVR
jgi:PD-(D/E)XK nuclease superfamily